MACSISPTRRAADTAWLDPDVAAEASEPAVNFGAYIEHQQALVYRYDPERFAETVPKDRLRLFREIIDAVGNADQPDERSGLDVRHLPTDSALRRRSSIGAMRACADTLKPRRTATPCKRLTRSTR